MEVLNINECKIKICKQASDCSLEGGRKMKKCKLVQNIMNFKFCYIIFCTIICFIVLSVPASAKEDSDNVIRVGSFEETYNNVNEKGERSGYGYEYLQDIDAFCTSHDIDDYDLFGEIMVGDDASYDELSDNILYE